jgi:hypothetical protein
MFGWTLARAMDIDRDGVRDLLCGELDWISPGARTRTVRALSGRDASVLQRFPGFEWALCPGTKGSDVDLWVLSEAGHEAGGMNARTGARIAS